MFLHCVISEVINFILFSTISSTFHFMTANSSPIPFSFSSRISLAFSSLHVTTPQTAVYSTSASFLKLYISNFNRANMLKCLLWTTLSLLNYVVFMGLKKKKLITTIVTSNTGFYIHPLRSPSPALANTGSKQRSFMCVTFSELLQLLMNWSVLYELCLYWTRKIRENGRLIKNMYIPLSKVPSNTQLSRTMYNMMSPVWLFQSLKLNYAASLMKTTSPQKCEKSTTCGSSAS